MEQNVLASWGHLGPLNAEERWRAGGHEGVGGGEGEGTRRVRGPGTQEPQAGGLPGSWAMTWRGVWWAAPMQGRRRRRARMEVTGTLQKQAWLRAWGRLGAVGVQGEVGGGRPLGPGRERHTETKRHGAVAGQRCGPLPRPPSPLGRCWLRSGHGSPGCKHAGPALPESKAVVRIVTEPGASLG